MERGERKAGAGFEWTIPSKQRLQSARTGILQQQAKSRNLKNFIHRYKAGLSDQDMQSGATEGGVTGESRQRRANLREPLLRTPKRC